MRILEDAERGRPVLFAEGDAAVERMRIPEDAERGRGPCTGERSQQERNDNAPGEAPAPDNGTPAVA